MKEKRKWKGKLEEKVEREVIHTGAVWIHWSEEAEMRFPGMLLQFLNARLSALNEGKWCTKHRCTCNATDSYK